MSDEVGRIRHKIEQGERLDEHELERLRRAAEASAGPTLKLAVAHALLNADEATPALPMLQSLRRDYPKDVQVALGLARAFALLERQGEAERALSDALSLNPGDPEAQKALAAIALQRGEVRRAREMLERVLKVDPFDSEARLILTDLETAELPPPKLHTASREEFVSALLSRLKAQSTPALLQRDELLVRLGKGGVGRVDVRSLYQGYRQDGRALSEAVAWIARELAERSLGVPEGPEAVLERVMPVLRDAAFLDRASGALRREGPADLWIFYVLDDSELVRYLPEGALAARGLSLEEVDAAAWRNLEARPTQPRPVKLEAGELCAAEAPSGLFALAEGDGHDGARLLTTAQQALLAAVAGPGPHRIFLGRREVALLCPESESTLVRELESIGTGADGISGGFRLDGARLTRA